jgi:hypothetical protein
MLNTLFRLCPCIVKHERKGIETWAPTRHLIVETWIAGADFKTREYRHRRTRIVCNNILIYA